MKPGFASKFLDVRTQDGLNDILLSVLDYTSADGRQFRCPIGGTTDGLSVPRCVQNIIPATGGDWFSGVLHDSGYRNQLLVYTGDGSWSIANLSQAECDALILEAMETQGVSWIARHTIYRALRIAGRFAFADNRSPAGIIRNQLQAV